MKLVKSVVKKCLIVIVLLSSVLVIGQEKEKFKPTFNWNVTAQIWMRHSELNEGSLVNNEASSNYFDVSLRRLRIPVTSQLTKKFELQENLLARMTFQPPTSMGESSL